MGWLLAPLLIDGVTGRAGYDHRAIMAQALYQFKGKPH
jgi:hypothetical protein